jgi:hypothetical protein
MIPILSLLCSVSYGERGRERGRGAGRRRKSDTVKGGLDELLPERLPLSVYFNLRNTYIACKFQLLALRFFLEYCLKYLRTLLYL